MAAYPGLQKRGGRYSIRVRVPDRFRPIVGKREITKALGTADKREALARLHPARTEVERLFRAAERRLAELRRSTGRPHAPEPSPDEVVEAIKAWLGEAERRALATPAIPQERDLEDVLADLRGEIADLSGQHSAEDPNTQNLATRIMVDLGYDLKLGSRMFWLAAELAARADAERARRAEARLTGSPHMSPDPTFADATVVSPPARARAVTFGELVERYVSNPSRDVSPKTVIADRATHAVLMDILGRSTCLTSIDREACRRVQSLLRRLPANFMKLLPGRSAAEAAEHAERHHVAPMAAKTANTYLGALAALFRFAESEGLADRNPARGLLLAGNAGSLNRRPFRIDELGELFAAPPYPNGTRDAEFWLPLLALFAGARLNELCQLDTADIEQRDGVTLIAIRENLATGKRLKTRNAARVVPLHAELDRIGFAEHVSAARRLGWPKLFPELRPAASGYLSDIFSKRFGRRLRGLGITDRSVSFHSLRHNFRDALREAGVPVEISRALGGWSRGENASEGYGSGFRPATLAAEIDKVHYPGLDLGMLYPTPSHPAL